ncbi:MAG: SsrA-binding protein SmpB [Chitinophagales bacterium]|nr:SsrA-binding protein SmpB [Sphingobacteriales bacterium]MBP6665367.1 SsrA-binding protein SmpB [Chitinophagales bacterium]MBP7535285.1 SsrA-binding protein SmpB [Chitinophagales bacterium]
MENKNKPANKNAQAAPKLTILASNRKAFHEYFVEQRFTAGIVLAGTEVKSVKKSKVNMSDAFCLFKSGELWLRNMHIAEYTHGTIYNHESKRERKLLLKKRELRKLEAKVKERGYSIIPLEILLSDRQLIKIEIALVKGKHAYDKRDSIKERDVKRALDRDDY